MPINPRSDTQSSTPDLITQTERNPASTTSDNDVTELCNREEPEAIEKQIEDDQNEETGRRIVTRALHGITKPNPKYSLIITTEQVEIPRSAKLVLQHPGWIAATKNEYEAFIKNKT